ncbi:transcriptional regulator family: Fungal Specific TF [Penicillium roqueforti]|uniref:transcriptional regulator family: Fungal Specific TF n=1 Tax=Penicillium roqueforti TaxID=5082 RepID=UPI00190E4AC2|nr:transcriptional regulator family: Fungal Specific TF [Penicillium roqueforti]KAF9249973.1 transcriptional regulator family: Fungal Specific TF [Penicillium roqueforti]KAI2681172.1 transcriptional regulator family: Fungal Specific TF [Penicillium roqueforti]KAI2715511.1 transcriptional regulator family: Fungal Specific TF [Penicillium roqueforti]KAI3124062.1 transcriptional regulator family: Fungal Specific TF [Penicillium roqueforti]KAI3145524.1 transcriptional regulator family: Fungal Spec
MQIHPFADALSKSLNMQPRANAVCTRCHSSKIRCDLEGRRSGKCSRCERIGYTCQPHIGKRRRALHASLYSSHTSIPSPSRAVPVTQESTAQEAPSPFRHLGRRDITCVGPGVVNGSQQPNSIDGSQLILDISQACRLPSPIIAQALTDFYFRELFYFVPVLDRGQSEIETSTLLQQCLCFAGSTMRQTAGPAEWTTFAIYGRIRTLLFLNHDPAPLNMLSALCILSTWFPYSPDAIVLDNPWQWAGMAIRLAIQLHLHENETYSRLEDSGRARRMWWYLFINDTLQTACCGRPGMFPLETSVPLPVPSDFKHVDLGSRVFCQLTVLCTKLRKVVDLARVDKASSEQVYLNLDGLRVWREQLPLESQLFDVETRQPYNRAVAELHIFYLVTVILTCFLGRRDNPSLFKYASMAASSCISRLYEEILYHEDVQYLLAMHTWANLVAGIPRAFGDSDVLNPDRDEELRISKQVLEIMREKHTSATFVLNKINGLNNMRADSVPAQADNTCGALPVSGQIQLAQLFPFPSRFCPMLRILRTAEASENQPPDALLTLPEDSNDWPMDWSSFLFDGPMSF